jgi:hypothetical protein
MTATCEKSSQVEPPHNAGRRPVRVDGTANDVIGVVSTLAIIPVVAGLLPGHAGSPGPLV